MLWQEKYTPTSLNTPYHKDLVTTLTSYTLQTIPHILLHSKTGHGKRTLLHNLIHHLYDKKSEVHLKITTVTSSTNKKIDVSYLECDEYIEITPSDYGFQDKTVIQTLIKTLAQTKNIVGILQQSKRNIKFVIVNEADNLSRDAQAALRRTVERYSGNFRIVLVCEEDNTIIEALRSRCLSLRVPGFTDDEIKENIERIMGIERSKGVSLSEEDKNEIVRVSGGNMRKALCLAENHATFNQDGKAKRVKTAKKFIMLEYEKMIENIVSEVKKNHDAATVIEICKEMYILLNGCIPGRIILKEMVRRILRRGIMFEEAKRICEAGTLYDERMKIGNKDILHLEGFVVTAMEILAKK